MASPSPAPAAPVPWCPLSLGFWLLLFGFCVFFPFVCFSLFDYAPAPLPLPFAFDLCILYVDFWWLIVGFCIFICSFDGWLLPFWLLVLCVLSVFCFFVVSDLCLLRLLLVHVS